MTETTTPTLADFLLARIAEDEDGRAHTLRALAEAMGEAGRPLMATFLAAESDRVVAECEAKRRIVEWATDEVRWFGKPEPSRQPSSQAGDFLVHVLAAVYADHPDYDESWRP